jgi:hypothetical protein
MNPANEVSLMYMRDPQDARTQEEAFADARMVILIVSRIKVFAGPTIGRWNSIPAPSLAKRSGRSACCWAFRRKAWPKRANLHWTYIGGIERGERNVSLLNIVKIARALETTASRLLTSVR